jgi:hypothetical protein
MQTKVDECIRKTNERVRNKFYGNSNPRGRGLNSRTRCGLGHFSPGVVIRIAEGTGPVMLRGKVQAINQAHTRQIVRRSTKRSFLSGARHIVGSLRPK